MLVRRLRFTLLFTLLGLMLAGPDTYAAAGVALTVKPGEWCDVVLHPDGFAFVRQTGSTVIAEVNGVERWRVTLPEPTLYLRAAAAPNGAILALGQSQSGRALVTNDGAPAQDYGDAFGQNGLLAWHDGTRFVIWVQRSADAATRTEIGGGESLVPLPWTSQGFRDVTADGQPLLGDQWFQRTIRGRSIHMPVFRANLWAGQWSDREGVGLLADDRNLAFTVIPGLGFEPHLARAGDRLAIAARTPAGAALAIVTPPYPANDDETHEPPPPPPPPPAKPFDCGRFTDQERGILSAIGNLWPELRRGSDDDRRTFTGRLAEQLAFSVSPAWGTKRADPGRPPSKDAVSRVINGRLCSWDVISGSTREMVLDGEGEDITGQVYIAVTPHDYLGTPPPPPPPDKPTDPGIAASLTQILARLAVLEGKVDSLASRPPEDVQAKLAEVLAALGELKRQPIVFPEYSGRVLGQAFTLRPKQ